LASPNTVGHSEKQVKQQCSASLAEGRVAELVQDQQVQPDERQGDSSGLALALSFSSSLTRSTVE
jgi:hypothetical protein